MYRQLAILGIVALGACSIEPTPREYIDRQPLVAEVRARAEAMLRDQLDSLARALHAGDPEQARTLLPAAADALVVGPAPQERLDGAAQVEAALELAAFAAAGALELRDLRVDIGPRANVGWFSASLELARPGLPPVPLRATGVLIEREARWELQQAHVSAPSDGLLPPGPPAAPPAPAADG